MFLCVLKQLQAITRADELIAETANAPPGSSSETKKPAIKREDLKQKGEIFNQDIWKHMNRLLQESKK